MTAFADASAVVKLFSDEDGTDRVRAEPGPFAVSVLTRVETASALWRKSQAGELSSQRARRLVTGVRVQLAAQRFAHGAEVLEAPLTTQMCDDATRLCGIHALRAGDAVQLATALAVREIDPSCNRFWVFDGRLADAAAREGFAALGPVAG
ncbi:MAG TPA: type II toxin-antitoxin system VapC family toxin [Acidimicrobiales bacterium]|nr:type II toxin-antitoxin system VapC family toxin [Acidimicrobiales bacterium]